MLWHAAKAARPFPLLLEYHLCKRQSETPVLQGAQCAKAIHSLLRCGEKAQPRATTQCHYRLQRLRSTRYRGDTHRVHHQRMYAPTTPVCRTIVATHTPNERNPRREERERNTDRLRLEQTNTSCLLSVPSPAAPIASHGRP